MTGSGGLAERVRYGWDRVEAYGLSPQPEEAVSRRLEIRRRNLAAAVIVTPELFPRVWEVLDRVLSRVSPGSGIESYIFSSPALQAYSYGMLEGGVLSLGLGSALVERLDSDELAFAVGHELGHCLLGHDAYPPPGEAPTPLERLNRLALIRAREISADRVGLVACRSATGAFRAMLKLATGLSDSHIRFDVATYLDQSRKLRRLGASASAALSTHPDFTARVRCLLAFEMSQLYYDASGRAGRAAYSREELENKVAAELRASEGPVTELLNRQTSREALLWTTLAIMLADGNLSRAEQAFMEHRFGSADAKRVMEFAREATAADMEGRLERSMREAGRLAPSHRTALLEELRSMAPRSEGAENRVRRILQRLEGVLDPSPGEA